MRSNRKTKPQSSDARRSWGYPIRVPASVDLTGRNAWLRSDNSYRRCRILHKLCGWTNRAAYKLSAAIRAHEPKLLGGAFQAVGALKRADVSFIRVRR